MTGLPTSTRPQFAKAFSGMRLPASGRMGAGAVLALALLGGTYALVLAQVSGDRGIAPTAASADIEVRGIAVDVTAENSGKARAEGWREAQRKAWEKAGGPKLPDGQLDSIVSAIVIEKERLGPKRYIATLGVVFDRQRAERFLGGAEREARSAPMLVIPVLASGGSFTTFELRNAWQRAWAEFNPGSSRIDYVRPSGAGRDSLLINFGQTTRRSRTWWRTTLDQYGASDVVMPFARLEHTFPGGPINGTFTARYGPDSEVLSSFTLQAASPDELPAILADAVTRMDGIFATALAEGKLRPDPTLRITGGGEIDPAIQRLIEIGRAVQARDAAARDAAVAAASDTPRIETQPVISPNPGTAATRVIVVQFATPDASAFDGSLGLVRGVAGIRGLSVTSTAIGGTSVMSVSFAGTQEELAAALQARGFSVRQGQNALAISR
ncbi:MAG: heavy-metal-associated domain-containing protein [Erythrobacter sp.]